MSPQQASASRQRTSDRVGMAIPAMIRPGAGAKKRSNDEVEVTCGIEGKSTWWRGGVAGRREWPWEKYPPRKCQERPKPAWFPENSGIGAARPIQALRFRRRIRVTGAGGSSVGWPAWPPQQPAAADHRGRTGIDRMTEVRIACRGWSAGHVKSRPSFNCRSSVLSGCLVK